MCCAVQGSKSGAPGSGSDSATFPSGGGGAAAKLCTEELSAGAEHDEEEEGGAGAALSLLDTGSRAAHTHTHKCSCIPRIPGSLLNSSFSSIN